MKLSIHSFWAHLYREFYHKTTLPKDLCSFFWALVIAILSVPAFWPAMVINRIFYKIKYVEDIKAYSKGYHDRIFTVSGLLFNALFFLMGSGFTILSYSKDILNVMPAWKIYFNGILCLIVLMVFLFVLVMVFKGIDYVNSKSKTKKKTKGWLDMTPAEQEKYIADLEEQERKKEEQRTKSLWYITASYFKAWKNKNCPIIEWDTKK